MWPPVRNKKENLKSLLFLPWYSRPTADLIETQYGLEKREFDSKKRKEKKNHLFFPVDWEGT